MSVLRKFPINILTNEGSGVKTAQMWGGGLRFWGKVNWFNKKKMLRVIMKKHAKP